MEPAERLWPAEMASMVAGKASDLAGRALEGAGIASLGPRNTAVRAWKASELVEKPSVGGGGLGDREKQSPCRDMVSGKALRPLSMSILY